MDLSRILKQIQPCDMDEPFVFVSYSSLDSQRVWQDVLRFQQMGYNVWLDEKNLDKTQDSWRADALEAIRDFNCALLVYYVSRNSLVSQPCFNELECTVEDITRRIHNGPVKFIAVDAEPISDIIQLQQEVHGEIRRNKDISKDEKRSRAITLSCCIEQFFNSNNEKVRVKAMGLPNRKMDYYEEIVAAFPDETRILPVAESVKETPAVEEPRPVPQLPVQKPAPAEEKEVPKVFTVEALEEFMQKSLPAEQETVSKNKTAHATSIVSAAPKAAAVTQTPAQPEKKEESKKHSDHLSADRTVLDMHEVEQTLRQADRMLLGMHAIERANEVFHKTGKRDFKKGSALSDIQKQNLQKYIAKTDYIPLVEGLLDTTMFQSGREGILVTQWSFDWTLYTTTHTGVKVPLMKVVGVHNGVNPGYLRISLSDGKKLDMQFGVYADGIRALLETFVEFNQKSLPVKQETVSARSAAPAVKTVKKEPKVFSLEQAFADANQKMGRYAKSQFTAFENASIKQMRNLKKVLGKKISVDVVDIEGLWGFEEGNGKEGIVVTEDKVYSTWMEWASVEYRRVTHVANGSRDTQIQITYEGQKPEEIWFADHCAPVKAFLQACIDQRT